MSRTNSSRSERRRRGGFAAVSLMRPVAIAAIASLVLSIPAPGEGKDVKPPVEGYRMRDYRAPTPLSLEGARTVTAVEAHELWREGMTLFIDVLPRVSRPPSLPPEILWRDPVRENIPGSAWLPDVGHGALHESVDAYFRRSLERLTGGDKSRPILFYCLADCWMSWNAAKRAREEYGYSNVIWFPEGTEAWSFEGYPLEPDQPEP